MNKNLTLVAIGNKARQGKDTLANILKELDPDSVIVHWADGVYEEVANSPREHKLIYFEDGFYYLLDCVYPDGEPDYYLLTPAQVPDLHKIFKEREITEYWGSIEKDSPMLQFWGTGFRRTFCGGHYWVNKTVARAQEMTPADDRMHFVWVPDTRFKNEYHACNIFVKIERFNEDGTQFIAEDRSPTHSSEVDLDNTGGDFYIKSTSGDMENIRRHATILLARLNEMYPQHIFNAEASPEEDYQFSVEVEA